MQRRLFAVAAAVAVAAGAVALASAATAASPSTAGRPAAHTTTRTPLRPVVFVHGFSGSASQFETPARRFASNGYPADYVDALDYDSTFAVQTQQQVFTALDQKIDALLARTHADKVDLVGHSLGTFLSQTYLNSSPARAARVAHYVNLDGATATALPGGVPTLAIWGAGPTTRTITGASNVYLSDESHTQTVTSAESFVQEYTFFRGHRPATTDIRRQPPGAVRLSGRAVLFPTNAGAAGTTLDVYRTDPRTGRRLGHRPVATFAIGADGSWGPMRASGAATYEFALSRGPGQPVHHFYFQPFRRTDRLIRLLTSEPNTGLDAVTDKSDKHANLTVVRNKEWWGDQGADSDVLTVDGTAIVNAATAPRSKLAIAIFAYDAGNDGVGDGTAALPAFASLPFITGTDLFVPAATPPDGTVSLVARPRGGGRPDVIEVPNWPSSTDRVSVQFDDYAHR